MIELLKKYSSDSPEDWYEFNNKKIVKLRNELKTYRNGKTFYRIVFIDIDDVINNTEPYMQQQLKDLGYYEATSEYRMSLMKNATEDKKSFDQETKRSFALFNDIVEETIPLKKKIDYNFIHQESHLFPNAVDYINKLTDEASLEFDFNALESSVKKIKTFYVFLTHYNPRREESLKIMTYYKYCPGIDAIITLPFHIMIGSSIQNSKAKVARSILGITPNEFCHCYLIDNSLGNCNNFMQNSGNAIPFYQFGFPEYGSLLLGKERYEFSNYNKERMLTTLEPDKISKVIQLIENDRLLGIDESVNYRQKAKRLSR